MSYHVEKSTGDLVIDEFDKGIAPSPHKGIANIQNANISTEAGEVMNSFSRNQQTMTNSSATGSLAFVDTNHVSLSIANTNNLFKGTWITVTNSSHTGELPNGTYYVPPSTGANFQLATAYTSLTPALNIPQITVEAWGGGGAGAYSTQAGNHAGSGGGAGAYVSSSFQEIVSGSVTIGNGATGSTGGTGYMSGANGIINGTEHGGGGGASSAFVGTSTTVIAAGGGGGNTTDNGASGGNNRAAGTVGGSASNGAGGGNGGGGGAGTAGSGISGGTAATAATFAGGNGGTSVNGGGSGGGGAPGKSGAGVNATNANGTATAGGNGSAGAAGGTNTGGNGVAGASEEGGGGGGGGNTGGNGGTPGAGGGGSNASAAGAGNGANGQVIVSYTTGTITATGGSITTAGGKIFHTFTSSGTFTVTSFVPTTVTVPVAVPITGFTSGLTASFTMVATMGKPLAQATENYFASGGTLYHRYYILDANNLVWMYDDQNEVTYSANDNVSWVLPDTNTNWCVKATGIAVISGMLIGATEHGLFGKSVNNLGITNNTTTTWVQFPDLNSWAASARSTTATHYCIATHTGQVYITDNSYIMSMFPNSALADPGNSTAQNVQTFCSWSLSASDPLATTGNLTVISGTTPAVTDSKRLPVQFFVPNGGSLPTSITSGTVYYISSTALTFNVYSASTGGSPLNIGLGASGIQYFNTFYPLASASASTGATPTYTLTAPACALPSFEVAQCLAEINTTILIGCKGSVVYPWNQQATQASGTIYLPEANVTNILTVNQMGYVFVGNKGNVYITDSTAASAVITVPDYCAGIYGTPSSYIEPIFTWGGAAYIRGRVYFSILDQTSTKAGNCGGIWSFIPTQNFYIGQDIGISLRLENQSSYGTYNGYSPIIITKQTQNAISPQYWNAWWSDTTGTIYGIDATGTGTSATSPTVIETEIIPTGTFLDKKTYAQIEFKLVTSLATGAVVSIKYRKDLTSAWVSCGTAVIQNNNRLSGYFPANFEKTQWLQLQATLTPTTATPGTFIRMSEIRVR